MDIWIEEKRQKVRQKQTRLKNVEVKRQRTIGKEAEQEWK